MTLPTVAIVGRPNVGKSTLFNRIAGERISIVEDVEGVTRDRIYTSAEWLNRQFSLIDTGGIDDVDAPFMEQIKHQADIAMTEADVIVFVVSGKEGVTDADEYVARILYKTNKPVILAVNKVDNPEMRADIYDFYSLGLGDPYPVSSVHGIGTGDVLDAIVENLPTEVEEVNPDIMVICHGGPIADPEDAAYVINNVPEIDGFFGASSIERLASERGMTAQAAAFKAIEK